LVVKKSGPELRDAGWTVTLDAPTPWPDLKTRGHKPGLNLRRR